MHEFSVAENLIKLMKKIAKENNAEKITKINLKINPFSCLDQDNLNFVFSSLVKEDPLLNEARIFIKGGDDPLAREIIVENVEIELK